MFKNRFGRTMAEDRAAAAVELVNVQMDQSESFSAFFDRFNGLRNKAGNQVPSSSILIENFVDALPGVLSERVSLAKATQEKHEEMTIDDVIALAKRLSAVGKNGKGARFDQTKLSTMDSKYAHSGPPSVARDKSKNRIQKHSSSSVGNNKKYLFHPSSSSQHDTAECVGFSSLNSAAVQNAVAAKGTPAGSAAKSLSSAAPSSSSRVGSAVIKNNKKCWECGAK